MKLKTKRLELYAATSEIVHAELTDLGTFQKHLNAKVPKNWSPELTKQEIRAFAQRLEEDKRLVGWLLWYWIASDENLDDERILLGFGAFKGKPTDGNVEIGYAILSEFRRKECGTPEQPTRLQSSW